jgi:putative oxidoreductase
MFFKRAMSTSPINKDVGLLLIRLGIGFSMMAFHGYTKITGGTELWAGVGANMGHLGIGFAPVFWGFLAAFSEFAGSILLILGVLFRPAALMLAFTMFIAILTHLNMPADAPRAGLSGAAHAIELLVVYVGLFLTGPGRYAFRLIGKHDLKKK